MIKVVVFDFDDVIVPSEAIKQGAYSWIFSEFGETVPHEAITESRAEFANAKGNRFDIIRGVLRRIHDMEEGIESLVTTYAVRYGEMVHEKMSELPVESRDTGALKRLKETYPLYVNSNTPDVPLRKIITSLELEAYFVGIYGSEHKKTENLKEIARLENVTPQEIVFIGDGEGDRLAAEEYGCLFIGVRTDKNKWTKETNGFEVIDRVSQLEEVLPAK